MENRKDKSAEILKNVLKELRYGARPFAKEFGMTPQAVYNILKGENSISSSFADKIIKKFPKVHYWYLMKGQLPVLMENPKLIQNQENLMNTALPKSLDYSLESFLVLKNIEVKMDQIIDLLSDQKKADNQ